ncbi:MAG: phosphatidate cytidylyltransferase [Rhizobiaceae bacterium]|nr:phosphatidate cytidylyltransferase [Rhizobiaceae bacterium]
MSNLQLRVVSAIVLAAAVLVLTWRGGGPFRLLSVLIAGAMFFEWCRMSRTSSRGMNQVVASIPFGIAMFALLAGVQAQIVWLILLLGLAATIAHAKMTQADWWASGGLAYAGFSGLALAFLRGDDGRGLAAILFLFAVVWSTDILAYFVGRAVGGPKLAPAISPGKTRSGAVGGLVGGALAAILLVLWLGLGSLLAYLLLAVILSALSQIGDLFESWVKRRHGVKDSSQLIPGHGGVMDRVDGLVVAALAMYIIGAIADGLNFPAHGLFG